ncbi:MAG TPA: O-antigen ligase family protein [Verrucomicrobiae bacterium]|nr:O-antigen ligase family protein [Verrucomicrobiae bacterium]
MTKWLLAFLPLILPAYLLRFKIGPFPTTVLEIVLLVTLIAFTYEFGIAGWKAAWKKLGAWQWPALAWMMVSLAACFWAPSIIAGLGLWRAYVLEPLLIFAILHQADQKKLEWSLYGLAAWTTAWALFQFVTGLGIPHPWDVAISAGRRATGPFPYPNALALLVVPIGAYAFARKQWWVAAVALLAALLARSNGGLGALVIGCWFVCLFDKRWRPWAIGMAIAGVLTVALIPQARAPFMASFSFEKWSGQVRLYQWRETWAMLKDHPLLGAGFGGYPTVFAAYHKATAIEIFQYPHNIALNFWSETGLVGLFVFAWVIGIWIKLGWKHPVILAPLVAILVQGLVDVPYFKNDLAVAFWILVFLTVMRLDQAPKRG